LKDKRFNKFLINVDTNRSQIIPELRYPFTTTVICDINKDNIERRAVIHEKSDVPNL
jgi:hypothetical protein